MKFDDCCCCLPTEPVIAYNSRTRVFHGDKLIYIYIYKYINGHDRSHNPLLAHARRGVMSKGGTLPLITNLLPWISLMSEEVSYQFSITKKKTKHTFYSVGSQSMSSILYINCPEQKVDYSQ